MRVIQRLVSVRLNPVHLTWIAALFFATVGNMALWQTLWTHVEIDSLRSVLFFISLPVFLFCAFNVLLTPVLALPYLRKPLLALLVLVSAACTYFMLHYGVLIDRSMVQNALETNQAELASYFSAPLLLTVLALGVLPAAAMVSLPTRRIAGALQTVSWWVINLVAALVILSVVGETARARNMQLNGYSRATNPVLSKRGDVIAFKHVASCGTATAISVPCLFSRMARAQYDEVRAATEENLLDILQRTGVGILWRNNNNGGCKGVCARVPTEHMPALKVPGQCVSKDGTCYDEVLLHQLGARIDALQGDALIVLHQLGSHGPTYFERYPPDARVFSPTCDSNQIQTCTNQALTNTYDNTLVYTDRMLGKAITLLESYADQRDVAMIYVSDHGESLGERGMYLHGTPYLIAPPEQTHVPLFMWFSPRFAEQAHLSLACLRERAEDGRYSHDNLYHSLLGLFDVQSRVYRKELDLFAGCRPAEAAMTPGMTH